MTEQSDLHGYNEELEAQKPNQATMESSDLKDIEAVSKKRKISDADDELIPQNAHQDEAMIELSDLYSVSVGPVPKKRKIDGADNDSGE